MTAASFLFVPADRPKRVLTAADTVADEVIVDLEDAVASENKAAAAASLSSLTPSRPLHVRVNNSFENPVDVDLSTIRDLPWLAGVVLPKTETADQVRALREALPAGTHVIALIESALGVLRCEEIASASPTRLAPGPADLAAELDVDICEAVLATPRNRLVYVSAAAGIDGPLDGPTLAIDDGDALSRDCLVAKRLGMKGKLCIHPRQLDVVNVAFHPSAAEFAWSKSVLEASRRHVGVFTLNGQFVDEPVLVRARRIQAGARA